MAIPRKDSALLDWSTNANTRLTASPLTYGTTAAIALEYNALHVLFLDETSLTMGPKTAIVLDEIAVGETRPVNAEATRIAMLTGREREVIGERIRDKIAASKKKGLWMGGTLPIGYDVVDRHLVVRDRQVDKGEIGILGGAESADQQGQECHE
mgnify:CR=1 FL=1